MSFIAKLQLQNEDEINVLQCGFRFKQGIDVTGKPTTMPQGGIINLVLESNGSTELFDWMISPVHMKSGTITFFRYDTMSRLKTLLFENAHCVEYFETFHHLGEHPMQIELTISAHMIRLNEKEFKNNWPE
jgi:hypothetical protein